MQQFPQIQAYAIFLMLMVIMTLLWFFLLDSYFTFLKKNHGSLFEKLGSPDIRKFKFAKERELIRHLFSDAGSLIDKNEVKGLALTEFLIRQKRIKVFFLVYIIVVIIISISILLFS